MGVGLANFFSEGHKLGTSLRAAALLGDFDSALSLSHALIF